MTSFKTEISKLEDKCVYNITIALFDYEKFEAMTQEQIDDYLSPDRMLRHKLLEKSAKEIEENQAHLALLRNMKEKYGDKEPQGDLTTAVREAHDRAAREYSDQQSAEAAAAGSEVRHDTPDGGTTEGVGETGAGEGGHPTEPEAGDSDRVDDGADGAQAVNDAADDGNPVPINRVGVES